MEETRRSLHERGVCVVIPTYNNGGTVGQVVSDVLAYCSDVLVVNDGSTDGTAEVLSKIAGIVVLSHAKNRGKGSALKTGFRYARQQGFAYAITIDADGQFFARDIPSFLQANKEHPGALVMGSRRLGEVELSKGSRFANNFSNFWFHLQTGKKLPDTQGGFRLYPLRKIRGLSLLTSRYEAELEILVFASWHGVEIVPIEVDVYYPPAGERVSHFRPGADFARISVLNTVLCILALVYGLPLRAWRKLAMWGRTAYCSLMMVVALFGIFTPWVWFLTHFGEMTEKKRRKIHSMIQSVSRFCVIGHGIPGAKFTYNIPEETDFEKPKVIVCNHQSHLDLLCLLSFSPNLIFLTNDWASHNSFYGLIIRSAEYLPVSAGLDELLPHLRSLVDRGYSIALFPEGTRSVDGKIARFHQGPFYIAHELGLDVLPMCLYGTGRVLRKHSFRFMKSRMHLEVGRLITRSEIESHGSLRHQASAMRRLITSMYGQLCNHFDQYA